MFAKCHCRYRAPLVALGLVLGLAPAHARETVDQTARFLGKKLTIQVTAPDREQAQSALESARAAMESGAILLHPQRIDSPLRIFNAADKQDQPTLVAPLRAPLEAALACARLTDGRFDPTLGPLVDLWDLRTDGNVPRNPQRRRALRGTGLKQLQQVLDGNLPGHAVRLDERGFVHGWMLEQARQALAETSAMHAMVRFGDHALVYPEHHAVLTLMHPVYRDRPSTTVTMRGGALGTAGDDPDRTLAVDGIVLSNVIDPRNGGLVPYWGQLTVWADSAVTADCLANGLYVLGPKAAEAWLNAHPQYGGVLAIARSGKSLQTRAAGYLR